MEERIFHYNGTDIHYYVEGEGVPVVLMHGWGCNAATLASLVPDVLDSKKKVLNIDFPGFGKSPEPTGVWGVRDYTLAIEMLLKHEGIINPIMVGHSFGGRVGILFSSRNKTRKLILIDAAGIKPKRKLSYYYKVWRFKCMKFLWRIIFGEERYGKLVEDYRRKKGSADYAQASPLMRQILSKVVNEDLKVELKKIDAPTLLIWGTADSATPISDAHTMNKLIADSGIVALEGAGHYSFLDAPQKFHAAFRYFLQN